MLVAIHQLHYLPWLRYFEKIHRADVFIVLDDIQYSKNGWQNRNRVKAAQGAVVLTVPVLHKHLQRLDEVRVDNSVNWARKHWTTIEQAYGKAPFFHEHAPFFGDTYSRSWNSMNALNRHILEYLVSSLGISTPLVFASSLGVEGEATDRLINLILTVNGDAYYSGAYALEKYLDADVLKEAGINLILQNWHSKVYPQRHGGFIPDLSVVDLLMNCGSKALGVLSGDESRDVECGGKYGSHNGSSQDNSTQRTNGGG